MTPLSTYRVQFHNSFTFADAEQIVPYLHDLGITHLYASPIFTATKGSQHGYDVVDPTRLNPELLPEHFDAMVNALHARDMKLIVDIVPNHMGVASNENPWWNDVLKHGRRSQYAAFFDIDFDTPLRKELVGKVMLPTLGEPYGVELKNGNLKLVQENGAYAIAYHDRRFPIDPTTESRIEKHGENALVHFNNADKRDDLHALMESQNWRLAHWSLSSREMNYRRFFDVSDLAALQMQRPGVFEAHHALLLRLIAEGKIDAVRIDHPDGLFDPKQYFEQLQAAYAKATGAKNGDAPLYVAAEKILAMHEPLPTEWPISGTSGYDFLIYVNAAQVDPAGEAAMTKLYQEFVGDARDFATVARESKLNILDNVLAAELDGLTRRLERVAERDRVWRDISRHDLKAALRAMLTACDVYRSYITRDRITDDDVAYVQRATERVRTDFPQVNPMAIELIEATLLRTRPADDATRDDQAAFAARFQQTTSPVTAKGIEDTAFYRYHRLISLNEVGGEPATFGIEPDALHGYFADRAKNWPLAMSTLSTHDTKRSEDVRARLNALSELPDEWATVVRDWHTIASRGGHAIRPADAYLIYQTLLGAWPGAFDDDFKKRIHAYLFKAIREAKETTSWVRPNAAYEKTVTAFVDHVLAGRDFYAAFEPFAKKIARVGTVHSLAQTVLKFTAPGAADTYQGTELWDLSLVDADNRRPVDYALRQKLFTAPTNAAMADWPSGAVKMLVARRLLAARREHADLFLKGDYVPLRAEGERAANVFAFARTDGTRTLVVAVPRLVTSALITTEPTPRLPDGFWGDTRLSLPFKQNTVQERLSANTMSVRGGSVLLSDLCASLPVAALIA